MRITDSAGIPIHGVASFKYKGQTIAFDTIEGMDNPHIRVVFTDGPDMRVVSVEEAIRMIDNSPE